MENQESLDDIKTQLNNYISNLSYTGLRRRFISDVSENVWIEIKILEAERDLILKLKNNNLVGLLITDEDSRIRNMAQVLYEGAVTGALLRGQIEWEDFELNIQERLNQLNKKYKKAVKAEQTLKKLTGVR